jgi:hypothetical protein
MKLVLSSSSAVSALPAAAACDAVRFDGRATHRTKHLCRCTTKDWVDSAAAARLTLSRPFARLTFVPTAEKQIQ